MRFLGEKWADKPRKSKQWLGWGNFPRKDDLKKMEGAQMCKSLGQRDQTLLPHMFLGLQGLVP